jgi:hypothetical protein
MSVMDVPQRLANYLPQPHRLVAAVVYLAALLLLGLAVDDWTFPPYGLRGLWFYSAAAGLVLGEFVLEPFFTRPADALANGSALLLTSSSVSLSGASVSHSLAQDGRIAFVVYASVVLGCGALAILLKDTSGRASAIARLAYRSAGAFGRARWLFGALYFAAVYAAYAHSAARIAIFYLAWIVIFSLHPLHSVFAGLDWRRQGLLGKTGVVLNTEDPRVVVASLPEASSPKLGQAGRVSGHTGTIVDVTSITPSPIVRVALAEPAIVRLGAEVALEDEVRAGVVGHVSEGTTIEELVVLTTPTASEQGLEEGRLVSSRFNAQEVLFQVTSATIRVTQDPIGRDLLQVRARKLGVWSDDAHGFDPLLGCPRQAKSFQCSPAGRSPSSSPRTSGMCRELRMASDSHSPLL